MHLGCQLWPQNTTWASLRDVARLVDRAGYDSLWTWDHFYAHLGDIEGTNLEAWEVLAAWGAVTERVRIGPLVSSVTYRHPAVIANMAATLDHISGGRAILGLGAGWFAPEHDAYGIALGTPAERSARLAEAVKTIRSLLDEKRTTAHGRYFRLTDALAEPKPVQHRLPILIGGYGQRTVRTAARHADLWHAFGTAEALAPKLDLLRRECGRIGRDPSTITTLAGGWVMIHDDPRAVEDQLARVGRVHGFATRPAYTLSGGVQQVAEQLRAYALAGFDGFIGCFAEPFDVRSIELFATEVRARLGVAMPAARR